MPKPSTHRPPDPKACAVARAVGEVVHPAQVILFGSRARGDFTPDSDIDLLIIIGSGAVDQQTYQRTSAAAHRKVEELYGGSIDVDLVRMSEGAFHDGRRARNHVAGQAVRDGLDAKGDKVTYDNPQPTNWPDIQQRIANTERELGVLKILVEANAAQEAIGFHAQQALENALKGWISALDADYRNTHDLMKLVAIVRQHPAENDTAAGEQLAWLTDYAVRYRYAGAEVVMDDRFALLEAVAETVTEIIARIRALVATEEEMDQQNSSTNPDESTAE
ncbi:MAG: HEPN domain-containing protein [Gemmatimonadetes bacterium]|nr:HEPN domain-containing protein [Gemmatimonadota bacterium]MXY80488.1 HEPN domain-containing protein [Gemmatimonadota bacterium]MYB67781.1 HEPN domain-containing protein [Gemmatimonadota bacterium]